MSSGVGTDVGTGGSLAGPGLDIISVRGRAGTGVLISVCEVHRNWCTRPTTARLRPAVWMTLDFLSGEPQGTSKPLATVGVCPPHEVHR